MKDQGQMKKFEVRKESEPIINQDGKATNLNTTNVNVYRDGEKIQTFDVSNKDRLV